MADGLVIASVHALDLHATPPVAHPQRFPAPSEVKLQEANEFRGYVEQADATKQEVPLNAHELR